MPLITLLKRFTLCLALLAGVTLSFADDRPNVIIILADDMGFSDIGAYGGEIETPTLDKLAGGGVKFSRFYNSARCCPTRASLMTGLHPHQTGIGWMTNPPDSGKMDHGPEFPSYRGFLNRNSVTIAEVLRESGYATFLAGKWHLGINARDRWPLQRGFEKFYGSLAGATNFFTPKGARGITFQNELLANPQSTTDRRYYTTDAFTDYAMKFIREEEAADDRPFFLYLAYTAPHWPLHAHQEEVQKYVGKYMDGWDKLRETRLRRQRELGLIKEDWALSDRSFKAWDELGPAKQKDMDLRMANYAAMVDRMDQNIGRLVDYLKATDQFDNTLILFMSDNGACQEGGRLGGKTDPFDLATWEATYGSGPGYGEVWANASNTPFRKFKHFTHEGGISTPLIAHWPKGIAPRAGWYGEPATLIDLAPTVYELAQAAYPESYAGHRIHALSGISLTPAFRGHVIDRAEPLFFEHEDNAALLDGKWKLVGSKVSVPGEVDASKWELYDLENDRTETTDLAATHPEKVKTLAQRWSEWAAGVGVYPKPASRTVAAAKEHK
ncbi:MAG: arylsulfatase [Synoicihabitans sp.]